MNHKFLIGFTAILILGATKAIAAPIEENPSIPGLIDTPESVQLKEPQSDVQETLGDRPNSAVTVYPHQGDKSNAATLYVRGIPILTFLGSSTTSRDLKKREIEDSINRNTTEASTPPNPGIESPVERAQIVASRLNQMILEKLDPRMITVSWNAQSESYSIKVNGEELVKMDSQTILPDTTNKLDQDALQATNRLRRLMGDAPPLQEIADLPKLKRSTAQEHSLRRAPQEYGFRPSKPGTLKAVRGQIKGLASWYGKGFHGRRTANGERYNQNALTAAHKSLPFGTRVRVTNINNGQSVVVRINDRGPFVGRRVIDLSAAAARAIGMVHSGVAPVRIEILP
jgi:rare lipoprotein A